VVCTATSNIGDLGVSAVIIGTNIPFPISAQSEASATITEFKAGSMAPLDSCFSNYVINNTLTRVSNNCDLNGGATADTFLSWQTSGFTTEILGMTPSFLETGPLTYYVDLTQLGLADQPFDTVVQDVEPYIHQDLIDNLPAVTSYGIVEEPGCADDVLVTDPDGQSTGIDPNGNLDQNIENSFYLASDTNPAVLIANPDDGDYSTTVTGTCTGSYSLSIATDDIVDQDVSQLLESGDITDGEAISYPFDITTADGVAGVSFVPNGEPSPVDEADSITIFGAGLAFGTMLTFRRRRDTRPDNRRGQSLADAD
jgi:hypothetical protein